MKDRNSFLREIGKALVATVIATASACWTARGVLADYDRRITVLETQQQYGDRNVAAALGEIRTDVRDLRATLIGESGRSR